MKKILEWLKGLICGICFLGQLVLIIFIAEMLFEILSKNQDLGILILYFICCEFVLRMMNQPSLIRIVMSVYEKKRKD